MMLQKAEYNKKIPKNKERESTKRLVLKVNSGAAYVAGPSARPPRGTSGPLPPLSTSSTASQGTIVKLLDLARFNELYLASGFD
jgi:hypothetical protein